MPGGRPSKLDPERQKRFVEAIKIGNYVEVAAALAGLNKGTVYNWMARGREAESGRYREFFDAVKEAEAFAENSAVASVRRAAADPRNWAASMTFLERRFRDRWGRPAPAMGAMEPSLTGPADVTDEPVVIPVSDRITGILDALQAAGKLDGRGSEAADPATKPVRGNGRSPHTNGTG